MTDFDAKYDFQTYQSDSAEELKAQCDKKWFKVSLDYAAAQLVAQGASQDALSGARQFVRNLLQLSSERVTVSEFPQIRLSTFDPEKAKEKE